MAGGGLVVGSVAGGRLDEELFPAETAVPFATLRVEDPQLCPPPRRAKAVASHHHLRPLADHVAPEVDPGPPGELETQARRLRHSFGRSCRQSGRLENDEQRLCSPGEGRETVEAFGNPGPVSGARTGRWRGFDRRRAFGGRPVLGRCPALGRQVDQEDVDGTGLQQRPGHRQAFVEVGRSENDQPLQLDTPSDSLDGIQASSEIHVADDSPGCLRLRGKAQGERCLAARVVAQDGEAGLAWHATGAENGVELRKARPHDTRILDRLGQTRGRRERFGKSREGADDGSGRTPALAK